MMKILKISVLVGVLMITACGKFLDVQPRTQSPQDILFNSEAGFKDALAGVYIQLKSSAIYGRHLRHGTIEELTSSWDVTTGSVGALIGSFNYQNEQVENRFLSIYTQAYKTIASINAILGKIDEHRSVFKNEELYRIVKGEALGLRAYIHFDILRLFGPVPLDIDNSVRLAYVTALSTNFNSLIGYDAYMAKVKEDLQASEKLLQDVDPILKYSLAELRDPGPSKPFYPSDDSFAFRYLRLNYYALKALQSRVHLWVGENPEAYAAAKVVIDAKDLNDNPIFRLGLSTDFAASNFILTPEHIFGLYDFKMQDIYETDFANGTYKKGTTTNTAIIAQLYGNTGVDIREANLWETLTLDNQSRHHITKKYKVGKGAANFAVDYKQIPMIRLSELYLIAAEAAPTSEGQVYWDKFLTARNLPSVPLVGSDLEKRLTIIKEYRKEFYAEGQGFYAYKRINAPKSAFLFVPTAAVVNYVVPLPLSETVNLD